MGITLDRKAVTELTVPAIYFDDALKGFGVRVRTSAGGKTLKSWVIQYRAAGKQRRLKLGDVVKLSPDQARKRAAEMLAKVTLGHDPADERGIERAATALTFKKAVAEYLDLKRREVRASSLKITTLYLTGKKYFDGLQSTPVSKVTRSDVSTARALHGGRE